MEMKEKDRADIKVPPPLLFFACLGAGVFLDYLYPFQIISCPWAFRIVSGCLLIAVSGLIAVGAFRALINCKTPFNPAKPTLKIVCEGPFRYSRNPLYLALLLLLGGIAALRCSLWLVCAEITLFSLLEYFAIRPEEKYLADKFGDEYLEYKSSVRRWL